MKRATLGIVLIVAGAVGLAFSMSMFAVWGHPMWQGMMYSMMGGWNYSGELKEFSGTVKTVAWMEIDLQTNGQEIEIHGPGWFWQQINVTEGDTVTAKGVFITVMEHGEGWHEALIPFELTLNGETYGNASRRVPVWMQ